MHPLQPQVYYPYLLMNKKRYAGLLWTKPDKWDKMDSKVGGGRQRGAVRGLAGWGHGMLQPLAPACGGASCQSRRRFCSRRAANAAQSLVPLLPSGGV